MTVDNSLRRNLINSSSGNLSSLKTSGETAHKDSTVASLQEKAGKNAAAEELHHAAASSDDEDEHASEHHLHQQTTAAAKSKFMITDILSGRRDAGGDVPLFLPPSEFPQNLSVRCRGGAFGAADPALLHHRLMSAGAGGLLLPPPPLHLFSPLHPANLNAAGHHHLGRPGLSPGGSNSPAPSDHSSGEDTGHDTDSGLPGENSSVCSNGEYPLS
jgi:hypothetical protein